MGVMIAPPFIAVLARSHGLPRAFVVASVVVAGCGTEIITTSPADHCIDYTDYLHWVGSVGTPGLARGVAVAGDHAYVAD